MQRKFEWLVQARGVDSKQWSLCLVLFLVYSTTSGYNNNSIAYPGLELSPWGGATESFYCLSFCSYAFGRLCGLEQFLKAGEASPIGPYSPSFSWSSSLLCGCTNCVANFGIVRS